jgi:alpha-galactosidase
VVFPLEISRDILAHPGLSGSTIALYDIVPSAAERTLEHVRALIELGGLAATAHVAPDLRDALTGAEFVITVFQVGGVTAYGHDVLIPREYGIDQTVGDTLGPGGIFRGLRTVEALRVVAEAMLRFCPDALLLNYANPMSINCWATDLLGVRVVGLCHSVQGGRRARPRLRGKRRPRRPRPGDAGRR